MKYKGIDWQVVVNFKLDILTLSLQSKGLQRKYFKKALDIDHQYNNLLYYKTAICYEKNELKSLFDKLNQKIKDSPDYLLTLPDRVYRFADVLLGYADELYKKENFEDHSNQELEKLFSNFMVKAESAFPFILVSIPIETILTQEIERGVRELMKKTDGPKTFDEYFEIITHRPTKDSYFQMEYKNLLRIGRNVQNKKSLAGKIKNYDSGQIINYLKVKHEEMYKRLEDHLEEYSWITKTLFRRKPMSWEDLSVRLLDVLKKDCAKELKKIEDKNQKRIECYEKMINELEPDEELKKKMDLMGDLVYLRTYRQDIFALSAYKARFLLNEIAGRVQLDYEGLILLSSWEISDLLRGVSEIEEYDLKARGRNFAQIQIGKNIEIVTDKEELQKLDQLFKEEDAKKDKKVEGSVASKGKAIGKAKIVLNPTQVVKVEEGDVLIAPMTSPDFVLGMLKTSAIVTDHGGVTSHAAIVSRELGVPCVVGTGNATKVFKDGDMVEVDAEKGVVRKLQ